MNPTTLPAPLQQFFTERLTSQMRASGNTISGYRDTFRLFLNFASKRLGEVPTKLKVEDLNCDLISEFLDHL